MFSITTNMSPLWGFFMVTLPSLKGFDASFNVHKFSKVPNKTKPQTLTPLVRKVPNTVTFVQTTEGVERVTLLL
ncbi:MAG: hypothetical protein JNL70_17560 [Saprospiraceae bacterium]|nr:hypothetical protein [Saprospiraceae bacterium]